jgi:hypothetical protein
MKSYIHFLNENKGNYSKAVKFLQDAADLKNESADTFLSFRYFAQLDEKEAEDMFSRYKKALEKKGYTMEKIEKIYKENIDLFMESPADLTYSVNVKTGQDVAERGYAENGCLDIILNEVSGGEYPLTGYTGHADPEKAGVMDIEVKYNYGWNNNNKYSKMFMQKEFGSDEDAINIFIENIEHSTVAQYDLMEDLIIEKGEGYVVYDTVIEESTDYLDALPYIIWVVMDDKTYVIATTQKYKGKNNELIRSLKGLDKYNL